MRELQLIRAGGLAWHERAAPELVEPTDALVRPFIASRCDGDTVPLHRPVSRALQLGMAVRAIDPVVGCICGRVPFKGPFAIGHECVAQVVAVGSDVRAISVGQRIVVPWAVSCGSCTRCTTGLTSKCERAAGELAAFGFGAACGQWGGMVADQLRVPFAEHMLVPVPDGVPSARVAAASDNLADAWRSVVEPLRSRPGGRVLVLGGGAKSIGLYAAGLAAQHGAQTIDYVDRDPARQAIAGDLGARTPSAPEGRYDVVVEATSRAAGLRRVLRSLAPGGVCTAVGYYLATGTRLPLMRMYATDATLRLGVSHARAILPDLLAFVARTGFPAERVTTLSAAWDDAPAAYASRNYQGRPAPRSPPHMISLHHTHLMASDLDATIAFWREGLGGEVVHDVEFAGARNVFLRVGGGRIHLYDQPPKTTDRGTVHHVGVVTDELEDVVDRLRALGHSVTDIRHEPTAAYAMAEGPDHLLVEIFQPDLTTIPPALRAYFQGDDHADA